MVQLKQESNYTSKGGTPEGQTKPIKRLIDKLPSVFS